VHGSEGIISQEIGNYPLNEENIWQTVFAVNRRQTIPAELRYTFQFEQDFPTDDACLEQIKEQRFPGGVTACHKCQKQRKH
jgi:hypothetical protein